jgi:hypothetical protein
VILIGSFWRAVLGIVLRIPVRARVMRLAVAGLRIRIAAVGSRRSRFNANATRNTAISKRRFAMENQVRLIHLSTSKTETGLHEISVLLNGMQCNFLLSSEREVGIFESHYRAGISRHQKALAWLREHHIKQT